MAIIGLTDKKPTYPQIAVLRKGGPKTDPKKPGPDLKYFRFDSPDLSATAAFTQKYGKEPVSIRVILPFADLDDNFEAWKEAYTASALQHRCDGQMMTQWLQKDGAYSFDPKPCNGGCKPTGRLKVIIPDLGRMAIVMVLTTSIHDIMNLHANLAALQESSGSLRGIPLTLRRVPKEISTPAGDGKRVRREKWLIQIEPEADWVQLQLQAQHDRALAGIANALPTSQQLALNAAPEDLEGDEDDDDEILDGETVKPVAPDARVAILAEAQTIWIEMGATEDAWAKYHAKYIAGKPLETIETRVAEIRAKAEAAKADTSPDDLIAAIERTIAQAGLSAEDAQAEIAATANGQYDLTEMDAETLMAVLARLDETRATIEAKKVKAAQ